jgi:hypothetical protein
MAKLSKKQFEDLKKIVEAQGADFKKFAEGSEEYRNQAIRNGYEAYKKQFPEVYGLPIDPEPQPDPTPEPTPTPEPEPVPIPTPTEGLLYDSNTDINWDAIQGDSLVVTKTYGDIKANGKGFHMEASGNPRMILMKSTKELILEHDGKYGRAYVAVCNYAARLEAEFKLTDASHNASFKDRCRHQFREFNPGASDKQTQGGQGTSFAVDAVDADLEIVHGGNPQEVSGPTTKLFPKLEINKYYKMKFSQFDKNGKIHVIDELDRGNGFEVVNEGDVNAPAQFFNKAEFEAWSEFWLRGNMDNGGRMYFKNIKMFKL